MIKPIVLFLNLLCICTLSANDSSEWMQKVEEYRSHLMTTNPAAPLEWKKLSETWSDLRISKEEQSRFVLNLLVGIEVYRHSFKYIEKQIGKQYPDSRIGKIFTEDNYWTLKKNCDLLNLINNSILDWEYPFDVNPEAYIFTELAFYDIKPDDILGDIGAGNGVFSLIVNRISPDTKIYINEIDSHFLKYTDLKISRGAHLFKRENITLTKGKKKSTELEGKKLNKVIARVTVHHFKKKNEMMQSIKATLSKDGFLFLYEVTKDLVQDGYGCSKLMTREEIEKLVKDNGFVMLDTQILEKAILYKFAVK